MPSAKAATKKTAVVQIGETLDDWSDAAIYTPNGTGFTRNGATATVQVSSVDDGDVVTITERDALPVTDASRRLLRVESR